MMMMMMMCMYASALPMRCSKPCAALCRAEFVRPQLQVPPSTIRALEGARLPLFDACCGSDTGCTPRRLASCLWPKATLGARIRRQTTARGSERSACCACPCVRQVTSQSHAHQGEGDAFITAPHHHYKPIKIGRQQGGLLASISLLVIVTLMSSTSVPDVMRTVERVTLNTGV